VREVGARDKQKSSGLCGDFPAISALRKRLNRRDRLGFAEPPETIIPRAGRAAALAFLLHNEIHHLAGNVDLLHDLLAGNRSFHLLVG
jgi:hypothetical protein